MKLQMGSQSFVDVQIPLLWGTRAVVQDKVGRISVINLGRESAKLEILGDKPAPDVEFTPSIDGYIILLGGRQLYNYNPKEKVLTSISLGLPECQIQPWAVRIGSNIFSGNKIEGFGVGIAVGDNGISIGGPLPLGLAKLVI